MKSLLCMIGIHDSLQHVEWEPDIRAPIVTRVVDRIWCGRCGRVSFDSDLRWDAVNHQLIEMAGKRKGEVWR